MRYKNQTKKDARKNYVSFVQDCDTLAFYSYCVREKIAFAEYEDYCKDSKFRHNLGVEYRKREKFRVPRKLKKGIKNLLKWQCNKKKHRLYYPMNRLTWKGLEYIKKLKRQIMVLNAEYLNIVYNVYDPIYNPNGTKRLGNEQ